MSGYVFVTRGDLTQLYCDAWLLPTDLWLSVRPSWRIHMSPELQHILESLQETSLPRPVGWSNNGVRVMPILDLPTGHPRPYLVNVGLYAGTKTSWYIEGVRQFLDCVERDVTPDHRICKRAKPLIGMPLVGTGAGGASDITGDVIVDVMHVLFEAANKHDLDIVLVTHSTPQFVAVQNARRAYVEQKHSTHHDATWPGLSPLLASEAQRLAKHAAAKHLVLFMGAGTSVGAGLPNWNDLLVRLADIASLTDNECHALDELDSLDKAHIIQNRLQAQGKAIGPLIADCLRVRWYGLLHSLLAALPLSETVTTNYDILFEMASEAADIPVATLPYQAANRQSRWLLKMHGCLNHPDDIVLTRQHFLRYHDTRAALSGIVQAMLMTRHMLFVGYSLRDSTFHQLVDDVRKSLCGIDHLPLEKDPFGTALILKQDAFFAELWHGDLQTVSVVASDSAPHENTPDVQHANARLLEIFVDYLLTEATHGASPVLDRRFDGVLTPEEKMIRDLVQALENQATPALWQSPSWRPIAQMLEELGGPSAIAP